MQFLEAKVKFHKDSLGKLQEQEFKQQQQICWSLWGCVGGVLIPELLGLCVIMYREKG